MVDVDLVFGRRICCGFGFIIVVVFIEIVALPIYPKLMMC